MPFLRAAQLDNPNNKVKQVQPEVVHTDYAADNKQLTIPFSEAIPQDTLDAVPSKNHNDNKVKGTQYERFVGHFYESRGYIVDFNGVNRGSWDGGIDLICKYKTFTVLVQCKCYDTSSISTSDIYKFYGACRHYALTHPKEIVQGSFWTNAILNRNQKAFKAAVDLGVVLYTGRNMPTE